MHKNAKKMKKYRVRACVYEKLFVILCDFLMYRDTSIPEYREFY